MTLRELVEAYGEDVQVLVKGKHGSLTEPTPNLVVLEYPESEWHYAETKAEFVDNNFLLLE